MELRACFSHALDTILDAIFGLHTPKGESRLPSNALLQASCWMLKCSSL